MSFKVCFIYPWATLGGVERVLLNRLVAFKSVLLPIEVDLMFLHDSGGANPLRNALKKMGIAARVVVATDFEQGAAYDLVSCIDCPQAFGLCAKRNFRFIAECHTSYANNRRYLGELPDSCGIIVTPSQLFSSRIRNELGEANAREVVELRNFVPWDIGCDFDQFRLPGWSRKPIFFFGRMDKHKDPVALLDAFVKIDLKCPGKFMCILCGPQSPEIDIHKEVSRRSLKSKVMSLPPVPFHSTQILMEIVGKMGGIFVSPSKGESFGLSAAEAISTGLPVVMSDIKEHCALVHGYEDKFTYELGNLGALAERILDVFDHYGQMSDIMLKVRESFSSRAFLDDWNVLVRKLNIHE